MATATLPSLPTAASPDGLAEPATACGFTKTATGLCMGLRQYSYVGALTALTLSLDDAEFLGAE